MVGKDYYENTEAWIKQADLFGANKIFLSAKTITYAHQNLTSYSPMTNIDPNVATGESYIGDAVNLARRKGYNQYNGINALTVTVNGVIDLLHLGSVKSGVNTMTPGILYTMMANGHKTYYFFDERIGSAWAADPDPLTVVRKPYSSSGGIPMVLLSYNVSAGASENILNYTLSLREDKE